MPFPHTILTRGLEHHCRQVFQLQKTRHNESIVYVLVCEDKGMCEIPGTFQHVLISANSWTEALQLWWVVWEGANTCEHTNRHWCHRECHLAFCRPLWRDRDPREISQEVGSQWRRKWAKKKMWERAKDRVRERRSLRKYPKVRHMLEDSSGLIKWINHTKHTNTHRCRPTVLFIGRVVSA